MNYYLLAETLALRGSSGELSEKTAILLALLFCLIFAGVGILLLVMNHKKKTICTYQLTATVIENRPHRSSKGRVTYAPVYQYYYNGQEYTKISTTSSRPPVFHVNDTVEFWIDPKNPETYFVPKDKTSQILGIIFTAVGIITFIICVIFL